MATEYSKRLQQALAPALKARGFQKTGTTWRRASPDVVAVVNIQGSQWSPMFYLNLGVYFRALGTATSRVRVTAMFAHASAISSLTRGDSASCWTWCG